MTKVIVNFEVDIDDSDNMKLYEKYNRALLTGDTMLLPIKVTAFVGLESVEAFTDKSAHALTLEEMPRQDHTHDTN